MSERTVSTQTAFQGRLLRLEVLEVELDDGRRAVREVVRHPGAAVILPQLPDGRFVLVRQFRKTAEAELLEAVAGTLKAGEPPAQCAARELREETGFAPTSLTLLGRVQSSPGFCDEQLYMYHARVSGEPGELQPDEDEEVARVLLTEEELVGMMAAGELHDAKILAVWALYQCRRAAGDSL